MNTNQLLLVSSLGLGVNLFGMFAMGGHHHHVSPPHSLNSIIHYFLREGILTHMVIRMDLLPVQLLPVQSSQLIQTTTVTLTLTRMSQQLLIPMAILILHLRLPQRPQRPCIIIHTHTLIRHRLLTYHAHPPIRIRILHPIRQPIVLTIHVLQPRQTRTTRIHISMNRTIIRTHTRIPRHLQSLMYILIHIHRMTIRLRTDLSQCQRAIVAPEGQ